MIRKKYWLSKTREATLWDARLVANEELEK